MSYLKERLRAADNHYELLNLAKEAADHIQILETTNRNLHDQIKANAIDAERYRFLRHGDNDDQAIRMTKSGDAYLLRNELLDAYIDAALKAAK
jgi:hypothetical protein